MGGQFDSFVIFAEMRTGSNLLESHLNAFPNLKCHGEAFNPNFIGYPNADGILGMTQEQRDRDPGQLLAAIRAAGVLSGFRYFHDHDPRVLDSVLGDRRCAKILLNRDPLHSYVSWKIARETGQWKLTDIRRRKTARVRFDAEEFAEHRARLGSFRQQVLRRLQTSGQSCFHVSYDDLQSLDVVNGLAAFLGLEERLETLGAGLKVQNPEPLAEKVTNPAEMRRALAALQAPDLDLVPDFEPERFAAVRSYVLSERASLLYMPIRGGPHDHVTDWMAALDGVAADRLTRNLSQKDLRRWKRLAVGHRGFTVVRHPVARAHSAFCRHIIGTGRAAFPAIRRTLVNRYGMPIPPEGHDAGYSLDAHRTGFVAFLKFLKANLQGQTAVRVDPVWGSQALAVQGFARFASPDHILRESELADMLPRLVSGALSDCPRPGPVPPDTPFDLAEVYDSEIEALAGAAYQRDYTVFGFGSFR